MTPQTRQYEIVINHLRYIDTPPIIVTREELKDAIGEIVSMTGLPRGLITVIVYNPKRES